MRQKNPNVLYWNCTKLNLQEIVRCWVKFLWKKKSNCRVKKLEFCTQGQNFIVFVKEIYMKLFYWKLKVWDDRWNLFTKSQICQIKEMKLWDKGWHLETKVRKGCNWGIKVDIWDKKSKFMHLSMKSSWNFEIDSWNSKSKLQNF